MRNNPGKTMSIYDLPSIAKTSWPKAACPENITNGFNVAGVYRLDKNVFAYDEFAPVYITDRPEIDGGVQQSEEILIARPIVSEASEHEKDPAIPSENCNMGEE